MRNGIKQRAQKMRNQVGIELRGHSNVTFYPEDKEGKRVMGRMKSYLHLWKISA